MILVFGILGLIGVCWPLGIIAWVMGNGDLKAMDAGTMDPSGRGTTQAGKICGIIATVLMILSVIGAICFFVFVALAGAAASAAN